MDRILFDPSIALVAPGDGFAAAEMAFNRLRLSDIAGFFEQACVNEPTVPAGRRRGIKFESRIRRAIVAVE